MANRDEIARYCDELLEPAAFADVLPNGLQVPGAAEVRKLLSGVTASLELFERAAAAGAQMVLAHHGMFAGSGPRRPLDRFEKARLQALFEADLSLLAYHLPLDAHPQIGNNALLARMLSLAGLERFAGIGWIGRLVNPCSLVDLLATVRRHIGEPLVFDAGPDVIERVAIVSGSAAGETLAAARAGADCFLTGEPKEAAMSDTREAGIHFVAAGHYATEVFGVRALGDRMAAAFGIEHEFADIPNPV